MLSQARREMKREKEGAGREHRGRENGLRRLQAVAGPQPVLSLSLGALMGQRFSRRPMRGQGEQFSQVGYLLGFQHRLSGK